MTSLWPPVCIFIVHLQQKPQYDQSHEKRDLQLVILQVGPDLWLLFEASIISQKGKRVLITQANSEGSSETARDCAGYL